MASTRWEETKEQVEYFLKGEHLQSCGWDASRCPFKDCKYIPDSAVLLGDRSQESSVVLEKGHFSIKTLVHATTPKAAASILVNGFKPKEKNLGTQLPDDKRNLIWWSISPDKEDIVSYSRQCEEFTKLFMKEKREIDLELNRDFKKLLNDNFCSSPPFCITSRYGNVIFECTIDQLLIAYRSQYCKKKELKFRVLGTFAYKQEVMHAIIVCPSSEMTILPEVPTDGNNPVTYHLGTLQWRPETTGYKANHYTTVFKNIETKKKRRWEHIAFAFLIPDGQNQGLLIDNLDMHVTYCPPSRVFRQHTDNEKKMKTINETLEFFLDQPILNKTFLFSFIHKFLVINWQKLEGKRYEADEGAPLEYMKLNPQYLEHLLSRSNPGDKKNYTPDELLEMVKDPAKCIKGWQLWIREMAHYLLKE